MVNSCRQIPFYPKSGLLKGNSFLCRQKISFFGGNNLIITVSRGINKKYEKG
jgi:hypothetical protein